MQPVSLAPLSPGEERTLRRIAGGISMMNFLAADDLERLVTRGLVEQIDRRVCITQQGKSRLVAIQPHHTKLFFGGSPDVARDNYKGWWDQQRGMRLIQEPAVYHAGSGWGVEIHYVVETPPR